MVICSKLIVLFAVAKKAGLLLVLDAPWETSGSCIRRGGRLAILQKRRIMADTKSARRLTLTRYEKSRGLLTAMPNIWTIKLIDCDIAPFGAWSCMVADSEKETRERCRIKLRSAIFLEDGRAFRKS